MAATILVVDDEKNIRRTLRMVLEGSGFHTLEAASAEDGLAKLESNDVDLVILDVRLPKMSGIEALAKIRGRPETRKLPVLMVSGHASVAEAVQAVQLGATDFFEKPLDRDRVLVTVRNALQTWQLQRELEQLRADVEHRYEMIGESPGRSARRDGLFRKAARSRPRARHGPKRTANLAAPTGARAASRRRRAPLRNDRREPRHE
jgi:DNA-binding NtrC family response regulator